MADLDQTYLDAIKQSEGFAPTAQWDYKQNTNGYGTKALFPGEKISRDEAQQRFDTAMNYATDHVDSVAPNAPPGARAALASLTFNAGPSWSNAGLGDAVRAGDWQSATDHFQQYNKAGGVVNPALVARRAQEASWFNPTGTSQTQQPQSAAPMGQGALSKMADPNAPAPDQSFLGALSSKLMAGGPGALFGAPHGVFPGAQGPGTGYDLGSALQNAGAWAQVPSSPGGGAALLGATQKEGPQFGPIGEDMFGQKTYGWINKANRSISPAVMSGDANNAPGYSAAGVGAANTGGMSGLLSSLETAKANGASREDLMKLVPPQMSSEVGSILNYQGIPASLSRNGTLKSAVTMVAHTIDPSYDERTYPAQMNYMKGLNSTTLSSPGGQKLALGTGLEHLQTLSDNAVAMNNSNGPMGDMPGGDLVARAINSGRNSSVDQSAKGTAMESAAQKYSGEVMKLYSGASGGGVAERDAVAGRYSKNMTPASLAASLETDLALMKGKLTNLEQQRDAAGIAPERAQFLAAPQKAAIAAIEANIARLRSGSQSQGSALPQGVTSIKVLGQ